MCLMNSAPSKNRPPCSGAFPPSQICPRPTVSKTKAESSTTKKSRGSKSNFAFRPQITWLTATWTNSSSNRLCRSRTSFICGRRSTARWASKTRISLIQAVFGVNHCMKGWLSRRGLTSRTKSTIKTPNPHTHQPISKRTTKTSTSVVQDKPITNNAQKTPSPFPPTNKRSKRPHPK